MQKSKSVKYVDPKDCFMKIRIKPTPEQEYELYEIARATNELFIKLLEIAECVTDKYRKQRSIKRMIPTDIWLSGKVSSLKSDYPELKKAWSSSQKYLVRKVGQRNWDRVQGIGYIDDLFGKDKIKVYKHKKRREFRWVQRLSERYDDQMALDPDHNYQIPIYLNPKIFDLRPLGLAEFKKGCIKVGGFPAIMKTTEGTKLYLPKMKKGIHLVSNGLRRFSGTELASGETFAYLEHRAGKYYIAIYDRYDNLQLPETGMPRYVKKIREEKRNKEVPMTSYEDMIRKNDISFGMDPYEDFDDLDDYTIDDDYEDSDDSELYNPNGAIRWIPPYLKGTGRLTDEEMEALGYARYSEEAEEDEDDDWDEDDEEDDGFIHLTYTSTFIEEMTRRKKK